MAFDAAVTPRAAVSADTAAVAMIEAALTEMSGELCPIWTAANPDRALAFLYVSPVDCRAVDVLTAG